MDIVISDASTPHYAPQCTNGHIIMWGICRHSMDRVKYGVNEQWTLSSACDKILNNLKKKQKAIGGTDNNNAQHISYTLCIDWVTSYKTIALKVMQYLRQCPPHPIALPKSESKSNINKRAKKE